MMQKNSLISLPSRLRRTALCACLLVLLCLLAGCGAQLSEQERLLPGTWNMTEIVDLKSYDVTDAERFGFTLVLQDDHSGTLTVGENEFSLTWTFEKQDEDGNYRYKTTLDGEEAYLFYMKAYSQLWLQNGEKTYLFEKR